MSSLSQDSDIHPTWVHQEFLTQAEMTWALCASALLLQKGN